MTTSGPIFAPPADRTGNRLQAICRKSRGEWVEILGELELPLTVFVVGRDLQQDADIDAIRSFEQLDDCEYGNHSLNHLPWMHTMSDTEIDSEVSVTHQRIESTLHRRPRGFRGPGFSCPDRVLRVLAERDYVYDASIFPTSLAPIARAVFLARTKLKGEDREKAKQLYGGFAAMRKPNRAFRRRIEKPDVMGDPGHRDAADTHADSFQLFDFSREPLQACRKSLLAIRFSTLSTDGKFTVAAVASA